MNVERYSNLDKFMEIERAATIAVPLDGSGTIHAATVMYVHQPDPLALYFVTSRATLKGKSLGKGKVAGAVVIGTVPDVAFTIQMHGVFESLNPAENQEALAKYYEKRGNRNDEVMKPEGMFVRFTPAWVRYTDYAHGKEQKELTG